jgi:HEPN domain-containing protein
MTKKDCKVLIQYWIDSAQEDWKTYESLRKSKRYAHALFFLHLTLEKILKAMIVAETRDYAPMSHSLTYLLGKTSLKASEKQINLLTEISKFNMESRYPDEKMTFYRSIDGKKSDYWHGIGKELKAWLITSLPES